MCCIIEALEKLNKEMKEELIEPHRNHLVDVSTYVENAIKQVVEGLTKLITNSKSFLLQASKANTQQQITLMEKLQEQLQSLSLDTDPFYVHESMLVPFLQQIANLMAHNFFWG